MIYNLERQDRWHDHRTETVLITDKAKVLWHVEIQHDHILKQIEAKGKVCKVTDIAVLCDYLIDDKDLQEGER